MLFSTRLIKQNGLYYNENYQLAADYDFVVRYLKSISEETKIAKVNFPVALYMLGGISSNYLKGIKEQFSIRRTTMKWGLVRSSLIALLHLVLNITRRLLPFIYLYWTQFRARKKRCNG
jgi:hypothetical protein